MSVICVVRYIFLLAMISMSVQPDPLSIEGFVRGTVILPCLIEQKPDAVFWRFKGLKSLCDISNGKARFKDQDSAFKNRVQIFASELSVGNYSIKLKNVNKADAGLYTCFTLDENFTQNIELRVKEEPGNGQKKFQADGVILMLLGCALLYSFI